MTYGKGKYSYELADWQANYPDGWSPMEVNALARGSSSTTTAPSSAPTTPFTTPTTATTP